MSVKTCDDGHPKIFYEAPHCPVCAQVFERNHAIIELVQGIEELNVALEKIRKANDRILCTCNPQATEANPECVVHSENRAQIRADMLGLEPPVRKIRATGPGSHGPYGPRCRCEGTGGGIHRKVSKWNLDCPKHLTDPNAAPAEAATG